MLRQLLGSGVFHADPHPGNVLVLGDGSLALLDFGSVGRLDPLQQAALQGVLVALAGRDPQGLADALGGVTSTRELADPDLLERALARLLVTRLGAGMRVSAQLLDDLLRLLLDVGVAFDAELAGVFRAMITLEGTLRLLDPQFNLLDQARRVAGDLLAQRVVPDSLQAAVGGELLGALPLLRRIPRHLDRLATGRQRCTLAVHARPLADRRDVRTLADLVNRVALSVLGPGRRSVRRCCWRCPGGHESRAGWERTGCSARSVWPRRSSWACGSWSPPATTPTTSDSKPRTSVGTAGHPVRAACPRRRSAREERGGCS